MRAPSAPMRGPTMNAGGQALAISRDMPMLASFDAVLELIRDKREMTLLIEVEAGVRLARYTPGRIEFEQAPGARADLASRLGQALQGWTGQRWGVSVVSGGGAPSVAEAQNAGRVAAEAEAQENPLVKAVMAAFPGAKVTDIRSPEAMAQAAAVAALPEVDEEWDPFEDS